jgi:hypothetical protein
MPFVSSQPALLQSTVFSFGWYHQQQQEPVEEAVPVAILEMAGTNNYE